MLLRGHSHLISGSAIQKGYLHPLKIWMWIGYLLLSLLSTQWLGLNHSITHQEAHSSHVLKTVTHDASESHDHSFFSFSQHDESSIECQLFDALTLTGIIASNPFALQLPNFFRQRFFGISKSPIDSVTYQPYQSRAPPVFIL